MHARQVLLVQVCFLPLMHADLQNKAAAPETQAGENVAHKKLAKHASMEERGINFRAFRMLSKRSTI